MLKSFTAAAMASYTAAQSAVVTEYSVITGTLQNEEKTEDIYQTSLSLVYEELVNGDNSYTVMNQTYSFQLTSTTWSTDARAMVQMLVCHPYTDDSVQPAKTLNSCA